MHAMHNPLASKHKVMQCLRQTVRDSSNINLNLRFVCIFTVQQYQPDNTDEKKDSVMIHITCKILQVSQFLHPMCVSACVIFNVNAHM